MIRKIITFFFLLIVAFMVPGIVSAADSSESIDDYNIKIVIDEDATISITETIEYNFGQNSRHGIYRNIPYKYKARGGNYKLEISDLSVMNEQGLNYQFSTSKSDGELNIKIGDPNSYVTGKMTYVINYSVDKAFNYFDDFDELYWNAVGTEWNVPILRADVEVILPDDFNQEEVKYSCYFGDFGSSQECIGDLVLNSDGKSKKIRFDNFQLEKYQGITIVVGLPKGAVYEPTFWERVWDTLKSNAILFLPLLVLFIMFYLWKKFGKDPVGKNSIVARYSAPKNLSVAEAGMVYDEKADNLEISANLIKLAIDGFIRIKQIKKSGAFSKNDYMLMKLKDSKLIENEIEKDLFEKIFNGKESVKISELKNEFYKDLASLKSSIYQSGVKKGYFMKNPNTVRSVYISVGVLVGILGASLAAFGALTTVSFILSAIIIVAFSFAMPSRTLKGVDLLSHLQGLKLYISVAESERIKFHNAPKKTPKLFEELLPYAMIFRLEKEWAKEFEGIYKEPDWYQGEYNHGFSTYYLASSLGSFNRNTTTNMASAPSSAASGGSGFSGGGVGGGFGGGGGGSW